MNLVQLLPARYAKFLASIFGLFVLYVQDYGFVWHTVPATIGIGAALGVMAVPNTNPKGVN